MAALRAAIWLMNYDRRHLHTAELRLLRKSQLLATFDGTHLTLTKLFEAQEQDFWASAHAEELADEDVTEVKELETEWRRLMNEADDHSSDSGGIEPLSDAASDSGGIEPISDADSDANDSQSEDSGVAGDSDLPNPPNPNDQTLGPTLVEFEKGDLWEFLKTSTVWTITNTTDNDVTLAKVRGRGPDTTTAAKRHMRQNMSMWHRIVAP